MKAVENHKKWVDAAVAPGLPLDPHQHRRQLQPDRHRQAPPRPARSLAEYGEEHNINIICENHGGPSSNPDALIALMKAVDTPNFGTLPDFGNFPKAGGKYTIDVYEAIARMMPYAKGVSAKSYDFDADGQREDRSTIARIMKIVTDAGYHGFVGIEYEGGRLSEPEGIKATKKLLEWLRGSEYQP